jgi:hypothetical protein
LDDFGFFDFDVFDADGDFFGEDDAEPDGDDEGDTEGDPDGDTDDDGVTDGDGVGVGVFDGCGVCPLSAALIALNSVDASWFGRDLPLT